MFYYPDDVVTKARLFAIAKHGDQVRKYTGVPYTTHLAEVVAILKAFGYYEPYVLAAAWLHDTLEDTDATHSEVSSEFGNRIYYGVVLLSDLTPHSLGNRAYRKKLYAEQIASAAWWIQVVKCADLISNTRSIKVLAPGFAEVYIPEKRALLDAMKPDVMKTAVWQHAMGLVF